MFVCDMIILVVLKYCLYICLHTCAKGALISMAFEMRAPEDDQVQRENDQIS